MIDGPAIPIWWRDDDADRPLPALDRLLDLRIKFGVPLALAIVPANLNMGDVATLRFGSEVDILVHGWAHVNHAAAGEKKAEFGPHRDLLEMRGELQRALTRLREFWPDCLPVFVPPWNRMAPDVRHLLPALGYLGLSTWGTSPVSAQSDLRCANVHLDIINWKNGGTAKSLDQLRDELATLVKDRRTRQSAEPIGILTHHRQMDQRAFQNLGDMFEHIAGSADFQWSSAQNIFWPSG